MNRHAATLMLIGLIWAPISAQAEAPVAALNVETFKALAASNFKGAIDEKLGVGVAIAATTANDEDKRAERRARLLCGAALRPRLAEIKKGLAWRFEDQTFTCKGLTCGHESQMEWDVSGRYTFEARGKALILRSVAYVEGGGVPEEIVKANDAWTAAQLKRLAGLTCASKDKAINQGIYRVCNTGKDKSPGLPMREAPTWKKRVGTVKPGAEMLDGTLVEDFGNREGIWWLVALVGQQSTRGWVVSSNTDKAQKKTPVLCPLN